MEKYRYCPMCSNPLAPRSIDNRERLACSAGCGYVLWDNPVPVVAAIVQRNGKIVLARNKAWPEKMFGLITGFLEKGESPEDGMRREIREELGLESEITGLVGLYTYEMMNQLLIVYHASASGTIRLGDELAEVKELEPDKVRPWQFGTGPALRDWLAGHIRK